MIDIGVRGCVVSVGGSSVIVMVRPEADNAITDFVDAAVPTHPIHLDFFKAPPSERKASPKGKVVASVRSTATGSEREKRLVREVFTLRQQIEKLQQSQSAIGAMEKLGLDDARLKSMLTLLHPDKHDGNEAANDAAKWINGLRDLLKSR